jgi:hypothetical protein
MLRRLDAQMPGGGEVACGRATIRAPMVFLLTTVLLPFLVITLLWRRPRKPVGAWITTMVMAAGVVGFSALVAPWGVLGVWLRWVIVALFAAAVLRSLLRGPDPDRLPESPVRMLVKIAIGLFFGSVAINAARSFATPAGPIDLELPLRGGTFLVMHGGSDPATNLHGSHDTQKYAVDFVKVGPAMRRARGVYPDAASSYAIWGAEVVAPCAGTVLAVVDGLADQKPGAIDPQPFMGKEQRPGAIDSKLAAGNHVILRCGSSDVWLAHLQRGTIRVKAGSSVATGTGLALVGNSGFSTEPHLHVHTEQGGKPLGIRFDGRWLVRNGVVRK